MEGMPFFFILSEALQEDPTFKGVDSEASAGNTGSDFFEGNTCVNIPQNQDVIEGRELPDLTKEMGVGDMSLSASQSQIGKKRKTRKKKKKHERDSIKDFIEAILDEIIRVGGESGVYDNGDDVGPSSEEEGVVYATLTAQDFSSTTLLRRSHRFRRPSGRLKDL